jgi:hypothetical protein
VRQTARLCGVTHWLLRKTVRGLNLVDLSVPNVQPSFDMQRMCGCVVRVFGSPQHHTRLGCKGKVGELCYALLLVPADFDLYMLIR